MKKDIRDHWVQALRSGDYKQSQWKLRDGDTFCCLGVLCDLGNGGGSWDGNEYLLGGETNDTVLPGPILKHCGLTENDTDALMALNDEDGQDFNQIANYIETWL